MKTGQVFRDIFFNLHSWRNDTDYICPVFYSVAVHDRIFMLKDFKNLC